MGEKEHAQTHNLHSRMEVRLSVMNLRPSSLGGNVVTTYSKTLTVKSANFVPQINVAIDYYYIATVCYI